MSEWLEGYWTAAVRLAAASPPLHEASWWSSPEWVGAYGSIGGAIGAILAAAVASYSAKQSRDAARNSAKVALETERGAIIQDAINTYHDSLSRMESVAIIARPLKSPLFPNDIPQAKKDLHEDLEGDWRFFQLSGLKAASIKQDALAARSMSELTDLKRRLIGVKSEIQDLQHQTENRQRNAWSAGYIPRPGFVGGWE